MTTNVSFKERINNIITDLLNEGTYTDFISLQENKTCNAHTIFLEQELQHRFKKIELKEFSQKIFISPNKFKPCSDEECSEIKEKKYGMEGKLKSKSQLCRGIAIYYVRVFNLLGALMTALDTENNMCHRRIKALYKNVDDNFFKVNVCENDVKLYPKNVMALDGIKELLTLYQMYNIDGFEQQNQKILEQMKKLQDLFSQDFKHSDDESNNLSTDESRNDLEDDDDEDEDEDEDEDDESKNINNILERLDKSKRTKKALSSRNNPGRNNPGRNNPGRNNPGRNNPGRNNLGRNNLGRNNLGRNNPGRNNTEKKTKKVSIDEKSNTNGVNIDLSRDEIAPTKSNTVKEPNQQLSLVNKSTTSSLAEKPLQNKPLAATNQPLQNKPLAATNQPLQNNQLATTNKFPVVNQALQNKSSPLNQPLTNNTLNANQVGGKRTRKKQKGGAGLLTNIGNLLGIGGNKPKDTNVLEPTSNNDKVVEGGPALPTVTRENQKTLEDFKSFIESTKSKTPKDMIKPETLTKLKGKPLNLSKEKECKLLKKLSDNKVDKKNVDTFKEYLDTHTLILTHNKESKGKLNEILNGLIDKNPNNGKFRLKDISSEILFNLETQTRDVLANYYSQCEKLFKKGFNSLISGIEKQDLKEKALKIEETRKAREEKQ